MTTETTHQKTVDPRANNAMKYGLFSTRDLVLPNEQTEYEQIRQSLMSELIPEGAFQQTFADEIISANWRLRRCGLIEANLIDFMHLDEFGFPMLNPEGEKRQKSADRARAQAQSALRRCMAEFRKLQTERVIMIDLNRADDPHALVDNRAALNAIRIDDQNRAVALKAHLDAQTAPPARAPKPAPAPQPADLFCKTNPSVSGTSQKVGPNAPCPCGSGKKYKKCCDSPEIHNQKYAA